MWISDHIPPYAQINSARI